MDPKKKYFLSSSEHNLNGGQYTKINKDDHNPFLTILFLGPCYSNGRKISNDEEMLTVMLLLMKCDDDT